MKHITLILAFVAVFQCSLFSQDIPGDDRMQWWRDAKFGMFIHWGLYAIPAGEWKGKEYPQIGEWIMLNAKIPVHEYQQLAKQFNPTRFDAAEVVRAARNAGMKYLAITAKHHDGFAMFKSQASNYNVVDATPFGKDVVKMLAEECERQGIKFCFYYSHARDWNEPDGLGNNWDFGPDRNFQKYLDEKVKPQLTELLTQYGPVSLIWFDTPMTISTSQAQDLKDLVRKLQPACIISGRLGGDVETDYKSTSDNLIPPENVPGDWEVPATLNNTWGYKKNDHEWKSSATIIMSLFDIVSKGGNYLLNIGPTADGVIPKESVDVLTDVGRWMRVNGESIYGCQPNPFRQAFDWGNITHRGNKLYLGVYKYSTVGKDLLIRGFRNKVNKVYFLADARKRDLNFKQHIGDADSQLRIMLKPSARIKRSKLVVIVCEFEDQLIIPSDNKNTDEKRYQRYFEY